MIQYSSLLATSLSESVRWSLREIAAIARHWSKLELKVKLSVKQSEKVSYTNLFKSMWIELDQVKPAGVTVYFFIQSGSTFDRERI